MHMNRRVSDRYKTKFLMRVLLAVFFMFIFYGMASAAGAGAGGAALPWNAVLEGLAHSLTGPVALSISLMMIVIGIGSLMFGGELASWAKWIVYACVAAATIGGAGALVAAMGVDGAVIL